MSQIDLVGTVFLTFMSVMAVAGLWCTVECCFNVEDEYGNEGPWLIARFARFVWSNIGERR